MKKIFSLFLVTFILSLTISSVFATEVEPSATTNSYSTETITSDLDVNNNDVNTNIITEENGNIYLGDGPESDTFIVDGGIPITTTEQLTSRVEKKGFEIVNFLQTIVKPLAIIAFIICGFFALIGAWGNSQLVSKGVFGMFFAIVMYVVVIFAPDILQFALQWTRN